MPYFPDENKEIHRICFKKITRMIHKYGFEICGSSSQKLDAAFHSNPPVESHLVQSNQIPAPSGLMVGEVGFS